MLKSIKITTIMPITTHNLVTTKKKIEGASLSYECTPNQLIYSNLATAQ